MLTYIFISHAKVIIPSDKFSHNEKGHALQEILSRKIQKPHQKEIAKDTRMGLCRLLMLAFSKNQKTVLLSKNRLHDFCYLTLFTFMRRSRTRRHMETKKVMMK